MHCNNSLNAQRVVYIIFHYLKFFSIYTHKSKTSINANAAYMRILKLNFKSLYSPHLLRNPISAEMLLQIHPQNKTYPRMKTLNR